VRSRLTIVLGLMSLFGAIGVVVWFFSNPEGVDRRQGISQLADVAGQALLLAAVAGFAAMGTLEVFRRLLHVRGWYFARALERVIGPATLSRVVSARGSARELSSIWVRLDLPLEQLVAQLAHAVDAALDEVAGAAPTYRGRVPGIEVVHELAGPEGHSLARQLEESEVGSEARRVVESRLRVLVQAALDDVQVSVGNSWRWWLRLTSCVLASLFGLLAVIYLPVGPATKAAVLSMTFVLGGFFAGFLRDVVAGVERWRS
jgi:hypothetical protein